MIRILIMLHSLSKTNKLTCFSNWSINSQFYKEISLIHIIEVYRINMIFKKFKDWSYRALVFNILKTSAVFLLFHKMFLKKILLLEDFNSMIILRHILKLKKVKFITKKKIQLKKHLERQSYNANNLTKICWILK